MNKNDVNVIMAFYRGVVANGPVVVKSERRARKIYDKFCYDLELDPKYPHTGESDVYWWRLQIE